jgi:hypothetical protein
VGGHKFKIGQLVNHSWSRAPGVYQVTHLLPPEGKVFQPKACPSTTTPPLNCFWRSAPRLARTTGVLRQRLRPSVTLSKLCGRPKPSAHGFEVGDERFNSTEIERLYEALPKHE